MLVVEAMVAEQMDCHLKVACIVYPMSSDDEDDSDDDLFSNMASGVKPSLKPNPLANILGDDSDDDLFSSLIPKSTK